MNISYQEKPKQQQRSLGNDPNGWPKESDTIWRVVESDGREEFQQDDLLLYLCHRYSGYCWINLRSKAIHTHDIKDSYKIKIVQDFTINTVSLYVDNSARP